MFGRSLGRFAKVSAYRCLVLFTRTSRRSPGLRSPVSHAAAPSWCPGKSQVKSGNSPTQRSFFTVYLVILLLLSVVF